MIIKNITDVEKFFEVVRQCKGRIEMVTSEGDHLNLKSKLSQYISLTKIFSDNVVDEIEIITSEPEDLDELLQYMIAR